MLEMRQVTKTFGGFKALDQLTLTVPRGAVYGMVGPNGAGKSSAIRHLCGVYRQDSGTVTLDDEPIYENPRQKARLGVIPDDVFFFPSASIQEMRRFYKGIYPTFDDAMFKKLGEAFDLPLNGQIRRFSKGMQKQAAFWLTVSCRPEVLILDEPVDGLDPVMRRQIWSIILADVAAREATVLISSHNLRELEDVCDHVGIMDKGHMLLEKSLADMQGNVMKLQMVGQPPAELEILHRSTSGRLNTLIVRGTAEQIQAKVAPLDIPYFDVIPLSLEEIFIYELGGANYAVKEIVF
ncbi:MAG: ABC transporter ATP-binding protein [Faecousia sp.]